jgi:hypothetical protein
MFSAGEVVAQGHQTPFAAHLFEAAQQEVPITGAAFERAERMFRKRPAATHQRIGLRHARAVPVDHVFMHPAIDVAPMSFGRQTL